MSAGAFLPDIPGTQIQYTGTMCIGEKTKIITKTIMVLDPIKEKKSGEIWTVHRERFSVEGKVTQKIKYYISRSDGIYLVAQAKNPEAKPKKLKSPQIVLPLPPFEGATWEADFKEKKKRITISYVLEKCSDSVDVHGQTITGLHIRGTGEASVLGVHVPLTVEMWMNETHGVLREINHRTVRSVDTVTILELNPDALSVAD
jgi:hypothetical protein